MACEGSAKGKVIYQDKGKKWEIKIDNPPFFVSCSVVGNCGYAGIRRITYNVANPANSAQNGSTFSFDSFKDETVFFKAIPQGGTYDGNRYDLWGNCHGTERLIYANFSVMSGAITITNNVFEVGEDSGLVITNESGQIIFRVNVSECDYRIACDKECPEGWCKFSSDNYPGYCCLNPEEISQEFRAMRNELRSKRGE